LKRLQHRLATGRVVAASITLNTGAASAYEATASAPKEAMDAHAGVKAEYANEPESTAPATDGAAARPTRAKAAALYTVYL